MRDVRKRLFKSSDLPSPAAMKQLAINILLISGVSLSLSVCACLLCTHRLRASSCSAAPSYQQLLRLFSCIRSSASRCTTESSQSHDASCGRDSCWDAHTCWCRFSKRQGEHANPPGLLHLTAPSCRGKRLRGWSTWMWRRNFRWMRLATAAGGRWPPTKAWLPSRPIPTADPIPRPGVAQGPESSSSNNSSSSLRPYEICSSTDLLGHPAAA